jgi:hypothetical protein
MDSHSPEVGTAPVPDSETANEQQTKRRGEEQKKE